MNFFIIIALLYFLYDSISLRIKRYRSLREELEAIDKEGYGMDNHSSKQDWVNDFELLRYKLRMENRRKVNEKFGRLDEFEQDYDYNSGPRDRSGFYKNRRKHHMQDSTDNRREG